MSLTYVKIGPNGEVLSEDKRNSVMYLIKILFRLDIVDEEQALKIANQYRVFFV